jgi:hypothetical protein
MQNNQLPMPAQVMPGMPEINQLNYAQAFYERLILYIVEFEKGLKEDEEVGARLVSFGESMEIHIDNLGYWNPSLICFYGRDNNGREVQLVQHVSQISILLMKVPRIANREPVRIGFKLQQACGSQLGS